jgi:hypothetical protein
VARHTRHARTTILIDPDPMILLTSPEHWPGAGVTVTRPTLADTWLTTTINPTIVAITAMVDLQKSPQLSDLTVR